MPKLVKELSAREVSRLSFGFVKGKHKDGQTIVNETGTPCAAYHAVGGVAGLYLQCNPPTGDNELFARSWILRTTIGGKRRDIGLGGYPDVTLAMAREKARELKAGIAAGVDPIAEKRAQRSALIREQAKAITFEQIAADFIVKKSKEYKTQKQTQKLSNQLEAYAYPFIGKMIVADIELAHIEKMLNPIWETKTETASRVRLYVEAILDLAGVKGLRRGDNPARWKGNLDQIFAKQTKIAKVEHYTALPVDEIPTFISKIHNKDWIGAKALEFGILTAARSGEIRGAAWSEIDLKARTWTIPAERMKADKEHVVPLSDAAIQLISRLDNTSQYLFPNNKGRMLSDVAISKTPKRIGYDVTAHGFRSTFKDWARKFTAYADEVTELALAHVNSDATRAAYARDGLLDKRRLLMQDWANYCYNGHPVTVSDNVTAIGGRG